MSANGNSEGRRARRVVTAPTISSAAPAVKLAVAEKHIAIWVLGFDALSTAGSQVSAPHPMYGSNNVPISILTRSRRMAGSA
jgi:hypothetical protein